MKIGFITTYFYPFKGGVESNIYHLAKELSKKHEVHIFTSDRKDNKIIEDKEELLNNIHIHRSRTLFRYKYYFAFYPSLLTNLLKYKLDLLHVHSLGFPWHDFCILTKKLISPKTKFIITPHGPFMTLNKYPLWQRILKSMVAKLTVITGKIYDAVIQVNPYQYEWLTKEYKFSKNKISYIPNGIDKNIFKNISTSNVIKKYNLKNKFIISYVGRLHEYKGTQDVIKVLPELIKTRKDLLFLVIGQDAGYYNNLKNLVSELNVEKNVKFIMDASDEERDAILELSEIFIMPSEWEAFGITILEAMAKENAVISTKTEGGKFLVEKSNGLTYNFGDTTELRKHLEKLILNDKIRKEMQKTNREKAKKFTWDKISLILEKLYKKSLS